MKKKSLCIDIYEVEDENELSPDDIKLIHLARKMTFNAYAPYSEFYVGSAILLENGEIVTGSNQENAAYPSGICAERVCVFSASSQYPNVKMKAIAVAARNPRESMNYPISPCGSCRQVLLEFEHKQKEPIKILLTGEYGKVFIITKAEDLTPISFSSDDLKRLLL
ncbi:MAG: cytidine deaminase [Bacteroidetes bacterium]|nr:cytidine deaminase [Bacteroidota bacterium]